MFEEKLIEEIYKTSIYNNICLQIVIKSMFAKKQADRIFNIIDKEYKKCLEKLELYLKIKEKNKNDI